MGENQVKQAIVFFCIVSLWTDIGCNAVGGINAPRWSEEKADKWYRKQGWQVGCNFIPSTAVNQLEMWQAQTFDAETIDRELGWAASIGFNSVRVYLHDLAWQGDADGFKKRIDRFLEIADKRGIRPMFVLFDDCWNSSPRPGRQPEPIPGVHNSRWVQSPGSKSVTDLNSWPGLERYVKDIVGSFGKDGRVLVWDLYNEPGNSNMGNKSLPLLKATFKWAREARPKQPLTAGIWHQQLTELNKYQLSASDVITFHNYNNVENLKQQITQLKKGGRPLICTEYLRRPGGSRFQSHLPIFKAEKVGCYNWGLVSGRTQTIYPWGSPKGSPEPEIWFHDMLRGDGTPFDPQEVELIQRLTCDNRLGSK